jgi:hypothetical protein
MTLPHFWRAERSALRLSIIVPKPFWKSGWMAGVSRRAEALLPLKPRRVDRDVCVQSSNY